MTDFNPGEHEMERVDEFDDNANRGQDDANRGQDEASFGGDVEMPEAPTEIQQEENQIAKNDFYEHLGELGWNADRNAALERGVLFEKDPRTKHIYAKYMDAHGTPIKVQLTNQRHPNQFLKLSSIAKTSGVGFVRDMLGITDYSSGARPKLPPAAASEVIETTETETSPCKN